MLSLIAQAVDCGSEQFKNNIGCLLKLNTGSPGQPAKSVGSYFSTTSSFINLFVPLIFVFAGIILFFLLIGGGFSIIASGGNAKNVESGKNQVTGAILGFLVIFAAYWIIQIIETITGVKIFNPS